MFRGQLNHTGVAHTISTVAASPFWNHSVGGYTVTDPAVVGGRVYIGSNDHNIYCLNSTMGGLLWNYTTGGYIISSPAVADGCVYIGSDDANFYCLNAATGELIWNYTTGGQIRSSPAVAGGRVYFGNSEFKVYCLNATTGVLLWNYTTGGYISSSPAVAGGRVYIGSHDHTLYCLNTTSGGLLWSYATGDVIYEFSPAVADGRVYIGSDDDKLYCLNASTGKNLWNYTLGDDVRSSPAVAAGRVYFGHRDHNVYCLNATTGGLLWNYTTGNSVEMSFPAVAIGRVYIGSNDNKIYCLNATTGVHLWNYSMGSEVYATSSTAIAGGCVYVAGGSGTLYCLPTLLEPPSFTLTSVLPNPSNGLTTIMVMNTTTDFDTNGIHANVSIPTGNWIYPVMIYTGENTWTGTFMVIASGLYTIRINATDKAGNRAYAGPMSILGDITPPTYENMTKSAVQLELGGSETITVFGMADLSGIQRVLIKFEGNNHTMTDLSGGTWRYSTWTPGAVGNYSYTIYIQDNAGNWNTTNGAIQVVKTTSPFPETLIIIIILTCVIVGIITVGLVIRSRRKSSGGTPKAIQVTRASIIPEVPPPTPPISPEIKAVRPPPPKATVTSRLKNWDHTPIILRMTEEQGRGLTAGGSFAGAGVTVGSSRISRSLKLDKCHLCKKESYALLTEDPEKRTIYCTKCGQKYQVLLPNGELWSFEK